ncbi:hypothetical protein ABIC37_005430 [Priestia megaterium]|uniref:hypothetical protein n=1 Tax=Priestia megaterium TaxID=1404 RepID=UPI00339658CB
MERLFMVSYLYRGNIVRAMLNIDGQSDIKPLLLSYHMETDQKQIQIRNIREYAKDQRFLHVWYCD